MAALWKAQKQKKPVVFIDYLQLIRPDPDDRSQADRKTKTDIIYMYLAGLQNPIYRTILRFKVDYPDLIEKSFKTTIKIARKQI